MAKKYDIAVKAGSYTDRDGNVKNKWMNIGIVLEGQYGPYILLNRTFNPAGVPCEAGDDMIKASLFEPKTNGGPLTPPNDSDVKGDVPF